MSLKEPASMDELIYFTRRKLGEHGTAIAWVYKQPCPKCKKAKMSKPINEKTGRPKIRSKVYVCPACNNEEEKVAYEKTLDMECKYTCPSCKKQGESSAPFDRKNVKIFSIVKQDKVSAKAVRLQCEHCQGNIDITKKMKS